MPNDWNVFLKQVKTEKPLLNASVLLELYNNVVDFKAVTTP